jgi:hypothetical protein
MTNITTMIGQNGAFLPTLLSVSQPQRQAMLLLGMQIPLPTARALLIDTGASQTALDTTIVTALGLMATGLIFIGTAGGGLPIPSLTYDVGMRLSSTVGVQQTYFPALRISTVHLAPAGPDGLLGRDVLATGLMAYAGFANQAQLFF